MCAACGSVTSKAYAEHAVIICWKCGRLLPPLTVREGEAIVAAVNTCRSKLGWDTPAGQLIADFADQMSRMLNEWPNVSIPICVENVDVDSEGRQIVWYTDPHNLISTVTIRCPCGSPFEIGKSIAVGSCEKCKRKYIVRDRLKGTVKP